MTIMMFGISLIYLGLLFCDVKIIASLKKKLKQKELELMRKSVRINNGELTFYIGEKVYCSAITSSIDAITLGEPMEIRRIEVDQKETKIMLRSESGGYGYALEKDIYKTKKEFIEALSRCVSHLQS